LSHNDFTLDLLWGPLTDFPHLTPY